MYVATQYRGLGDAVVNTPNPALLAQIQNEMQAHQISEYTGYAIAAAVFLFAPGFWKLLALPVAFLWTPQSI